MASYSCQRVQVLHVDDDPSITDLTATLLEREDDRFAVETATSADEGLQRIDGSPPDCVVSDYNMPGLDGLEFLQTVRAEYSDLPFILFTGKGSEAVASEAISAGVTDYLQKQGGTEQYELLANRIQNVVHAQRETRRADRQEKLMRLTEFAGDTGGFELDLESEDVLLTEGACRLVGVPEDAHITVDEAIGFYHPDDQADVRRTLTQVAETGEQTRGTWRLQTVDGDERLVDVTITPATDDSEVTTLRGSIHDITERSERQQALERLQQAIDGAGVPITLADPSRDDTPLVYANDAFEEVTGYPPEEAIGRNCRFLQGEDTDPATVAALRDAIADEKPISVELRNYRKDGTEFWNHLTLTPIYDDAGRLVRYLGTQEDITERRERERELRAERRFIEQALDTLEDLFYVLDTDGTLQRWNERLPAVTGYTNPELADVHAIELFPADERDTIADAIETTLTEGHPAVEADLQTVDGERVPYEFTGAQLTDEDGTVTGLVGVGRDLTERRRHERRFRALVEESNDLISIVDAHGVFQYQSPSMERILGYRPQETIGDTAWEYVHPDDRSALIEAFEHGVNDADANPVVEYRARHADGSWRWMESRGNNQLDTPAVEGYIVTSRDVTTRKERERELEAQNERLDEFTSIVSHDLRSPLSVAETALELVDAGKADEPLARAAEAIERSQTLVDDLLTLARHGDRLDETVSLDLAEVAQRCWQTTATGQATLEIADPGVISGDRKRIRQLLENLYRNAVEHGGNEVTVRVGATHDGFYVSDTGSGISEGARETVFEAGYSTTADGTGFGLRIVERVARAHGWTVTAAESRQGGARFEVTGVERRE